MSLRPSREEQLAAREAKLPKWAQQELGRLRRDLEAAQKRLTAGPEDSDTFVQSYSYGDIPLGDSPSILFKVGESWQDKFTVRREGKYLNVMGGGMIAVMPRGGNVVRIFIEERL